MIHTPITNNISSTVERPASWQVDWSSEDQDEQWDTFVASAPGGNHLQTCLWGAVKRSIGWRPIRVILSQPDRILAGAQLLIRKITPGVAVCYITRGPLFEPGYEFLADHIIKEILNFGQRKHLTFLAIQPTMNGDFLVPGLLHHGFECSTLELAPTATILIDLNQEEDQILGNMKRQTRQNVRRSTRDGIVTRVGDEKDLSTFYSLHCQTSQRQDFFPYPKIYIDRMWSAFAPTQNICLIFSEYNHEPVSSLLLIAFGEIVCAKLLGWSGLYGEHRPNDALFWSAIQWSKSNGYHYFDLEGIEREAAIALMQGSDLPEKFLHTPDLLKLGFGGQVRLFPEAYEYSYNPIVRSLTRKLEMKVGGHSWTSKMIDRIRKR